MLWLILAALVSNAHAGRKKKDFVPDPPVRPVVEQVESTNTIEPGSLWSEAAAGQVIGFNGIARRVGDLVTVRIVERTTTSLDAGTSTSKDSESSAGLGSMLGLEQSIGRATPGLSGGVDISAGSSSKFDGSGTTSRGSTLESSITCEVIEVLANGNLRVWGSKQVRVNREIQYVVVDGVVRPRDIQMDNTVPSELLASAKIEVTGGGVIADKQGPGFGARVLDWLWPF